MKEPNAPIVTDGSMGASINSNAVLMDQESGIAIQAVWTGTPVGNFTIESSCDVGQINPSTGQPSGISNWVYYNGSTVAAGGDVGKLIWNIEPIAVKWVRLVYTRTSGTGTLNARFNAQGD